jgi:hypothetical protein
MMAKASQWLASLSSLAAGRKVAMESVVIMARARCHRLWQPRLV